MLAAGVCLCFSLQAEAQPLPASGEPADCEDPAFLSRLGQILENMDAESRMADLARLGADLPPHLMAECPKMLAMFKRPKDRETFSASCMQAYGRKDPQKALETAGRFPSGLIRRTAQVAAVEGWAEKEPQAALEWAVKNLTARARRNALARAITRWALAAPQKAAAWVRANETDVGTSMVVLPELMRVWAAREPEAAAAWSQDMPRGDFHDLAISGALFAWADEFPEGAARWLTQNPGNEWLVPRVAAIWAELEPQKAAEWVLSVKQPQGFAPIMLVWADESPEEALRWCKASLTGDDLEEMSDFVLQTWGGDQPRAALTWVGKEFHGEKMEIAAATVMDAWLGDSKTPLPEISAWLSTLQPGVLRDVGLEKLAVALEPAFPQQALVAALKIQDRKRMQKTVATVWEAWRLREPLAARKWLNEHPELQRFIFSHISNESEELQGQAG